MLLLRGRSILSFRKIVRKESKDKKWGFPFSLFLILIAFSLAAWLSWFFHFFFIKNNWILIISESNYLQKKGGEKGKRTRRGRSRRYRRHKIQASSLFFGIHFFFNFWPIFTKVSSLVGRKRKAIEFSKAKTGHCSTTMVPELISIGGCLKIFISLLRSRVLQRLLLRKSLLLMKLQSKNWHETWYTRTDKAFFILVHQKRSSKNVH